MKNDVTYYLTLLVTFAVYCFSYLHRHSYLCLIVVFALTIPFALAFEKATDAVIRQLEKK